MGLEIHLLGPPRILRDGAPVRAPRGTKVWGLLAYLLLRDVPPSRAQLAELLFPEADDPLAALRWGLWQLRKLLGDDVVAGDPVGFSWSRRPFVDALAVRSARLAELRSPGTPERSLLEGIRFPGCPAFELWLEGERRHAQGAAAGLLHEAALSLLARDSADEAADLAARLVALDPFDENSQALLVRSLAVGGHGVGAARQAAACRELFRAELGVEPGPGLDAALAATTSAPTSGPVSGRAGIRALIEAGQAAIGAGALDAGLQTLRRAVGDSGALADDVLSAQACTALGSALVHAARGGDEEGVTSLHRSLTFAGASPSTRSETLCELGYVEFLRGRYDRVENWLTQAEAHTVDDARRALVLSVRGSTLSDQGRYPQALVALAESARLARLAGDERRRSYALSMTGRVHLLSGDLDRAADVLDESLARAVGWTTFLPWPESLRAEVHLLRGDVAAADAGFEHAFALGCQIGDPCWEGLAARGVGLVLAAKGDVGQAVPTLLDARRRAGRLPDAYVWVKAYVLAALVALGTEHGLPAARQWAAELTELTDRCGI